MNTEINNVELTEEELKELETYKSGYESCGLHESGKDE